MIVIDRWIYIIYVELQINCGDRSMSSNHDDVLTMSVLDLANNDHFGIRVKSVLRIAYNQGILTVKDLIQTGVKSIPNVGNKAIWSIQEVLVEEYHLSWDVFKNNTWKFKY